jgi:hypothetical protein
MARIDDPFSELSAQKRIFCMQIGISDFQIDIPISDFSLRELSEPLLDVSRFRAILHSRSITMSDDDHSDSGSSLATSGVELGFARKALRGVPAICAPRWSAWDGGKLGGRPVRRFSDSYSLK